MRIGFISCSNTLMTPEEIEVIVDELRSKNVDIIYHGEKNISDDQLHRLVKNLKLSDEIIVVTSCEKHRFVSSALSIPKVLIYQCNGFIERDKFIMENSDILFVLEEKNSKYNTIIKQAQSNNKIIIMVGKDGTTEKWPDVKYMPKNIDKGILKHAAGFA